MSPKDSRVIKAYIIVNNLYQCVGTLKGLLWGLDKAHDPKRRRLFAKKLHRKLKSLARYNAELRDALEPVLGKPSIDPEPVASLFDE